MIEAINLKPEVTEALEALINLDGALNAVIASDVEKRGAA